MKSLLKLYLLKRRFGYSRRAAFHAALRLVRVMNRSLR